MHGGNESGASEFIFWPDTEREVRMTDRVSDYGPFHAGDRISFRTTGGGGWGKPEKRACERIEEDLKNGLLSLEDAKRVYGYENVST